LSGPYAFRGQARRRRENRGFQCRLLPDTLASLREPWEAKTTLKNLKMLVQLHKKRGDAAPGEDGVLKDLEDLPKAGNPAS